MPGLRRFNMVINGEAAEVALHPGGKVTLSTGDQVQTFASIASLFASGSFGDLRQWASNQTAILRQYFPADGEPPLPLRAELRSATGGSQVLDDAGLDAYLGQASDHRLMVVVMDGPAGMGKTSQIRALAFKRAQAMARTGDRLILHVESRGSNLQVLDDLIAGSLQRIRAKPTFEQLRVLVKYGLVLLALDGFDELADPSGFVNAWAQLADLLGSVPGKAQVILAGRETLVSRERLLQEIASRRGGPAPPEVRRRLPDRGDASEPPHAAAARPARAGGS